MFAALVSRYVVKKNGFDHFYTEVREYTCKHSVLKQKETEATNLKLVLQYLISIIKTIRYFYIIYSFLLFFYNLYLLMNCSVNFKSFDT